MAPERRRTRKPNDPEHISHESSSLQPSRPSHVKKHAPQLHKVHLLETLSSETACSNNDLVNKEDKEEKDRMRKAMNQRKYYERYAYPFCLRPHPP